VLPPIPQGLIPVSAQQDAVKPRPDIPPVTPAQESSNDSAISLDRRHPQEAQEIIDEQRRRQARRRAAAAAGIPLEEDEEGGEKPSGDLDDLPRQGLWVDVEV